ncbi:hypothetical protein [Ferroacidibacillus organovorans]|uniref:Uncharacterized protein n=1 Tax=Ferroacidibacillus organovorans TaxID=1765683 RepID=A0A853KD75_9BACL|nr:hypothetical protein [Ferroacidibacillus organovorans]KYP80199.1 hypothetical protein AYJ22_02885 [Ferroacidibacillus organovorans]OAG95075.1 hypothetical protein AYW79_02360 [Ferroacidibacillus organovorans]
MAAIINCGFIKTSAQANDVGIFFGQNIQNGWDSHAVTKVAAYLNMGDATIAFLMNSVYIDSDVIDSPIIDPDIKSPMAPVFQGF